MKPSTPKTELPPSIQLRKAVFGGSLMKTTRLYFAALFCFSFSLIAQSFGAEPATLLTEMIDVGDHKLQIARSGSGSPTVVFEAGGGQDIKAWSSILPRIGEITSAVSYARAGRGASEPATGPRTPTIIVEELHTLLERAGYKPPYILVGTSLGGTYVRVFAMRYPTDVAGLVLVDGVHERLEMELDRLRGFTPAQRAERAAASAKEARENKTGGASGMESAGWANITASGDLGMLGKLPDVPMVVMTSISKGNWPNPAQRKIWRDLASEVFQATSHGMHIVTDKVGHSIHVEDPDIVVNAIRWVIDTTRPRRNSPVIPLDEISGPDNSIIDRKLGLSATLPAGWTVVSATRMPDFNNPIWPDGFTWIQLLSPEAQPKIVYQSVTDGKAIAATEVDAWLRNRASQVAAKRSAEGDVTEYKNGPASFVSRTVGGRPAVSWVADFKRGGKTWIEDVTAIYSEKIHAMIMVQALATEIDDIRPKFESLVESVRLP